MMVKDYYQCAMHGRTRVIDLLLSQVTGSDIGI